MNSLLFRKVATMDWDCIDANTQYLTHAIHRYSGKFIPQIARQTIELLTKPGDLVFDPYCGSGTTLLESSLTGRRSIGMDLNPLGVLISRVKTTPIENGLLRNFERTFEDSIRSLSEEMRQLPLFNRPSLKPGELTEKIHQDPKWSDPWYTKWFKDNARFELIALHQKIQAVENHDCRNLALIAFSDILRKCSNASSSYPNVMFDRNKGAPPIAILSFIERFREIADSVSNLEKSLAGKPMPVTLLGNARLMPFRECSVDAVITHPPYIGSIPYAEYGLLSLVWLGHDPQKLDTELTGGKRQKKDVLERYRIGFRDMINEAYRVLKAGGFLFMLLGNPLVKGNRIDLAAMAKQFALSEGFSLSATYQRNGINRRANLMGQEALIFFQKE